MMKSILAIFLITLLQVAAFAPRSQRPTNVALSMKGSDMVGSSAPLGFFDPLGFSKTDDATLAKYRESELKHGRVAMLAAFGWLTAEKFHPFYDGKLSGNGLKAFLETPPLGFVQIVAFIGLCEYVSGTVTKSSAYKTGDILGVGSLIPAGAQKDSQWVSFQTRELNNGRLAMIAIMGMIAQAGVTGKGTLEQLGF